MKQTSYEKVRNAITFNNPDSLPFEFEVFDDSDTYTVNWNQIGTGNHESKITYDEWGCKWERTDIENMGLITKHPLISWDNLVEYQFPNPNRKELFRGMKEKLEKSGDKYVKTGIFMLIFERLQSLRGFENTLVDIYLEDERIYRLADEIVDYDISIIHNIAKECKGGIHGFQFSDDWGTETSSIISKEKWDAFFKPRYMRIFDVIKSYDWHIWMHSCGKINELIPSFIDIGVDVLNMQQPTVNGIIELEKRFAGKVCFSTLCDIQKTLPFKDYKEIELEAETIINHLGTKSGGLIISDYGDGAAIGVTEDKKKVMYDAFKKYDYYCAMN